MACGVEVSRALRCRGPVGKRWCYGKGSKYVDRIKPIDRDLLVECAKATGAFVTAEDHNIIGGLGGAVSECLAQFSPCPVEFIGVNDSFGESGEPDELAEKYGLSPLDIFQMQESAFCHERMAL